MKKRGKSVSIIIIVLGAINLVIAALDIIAGNPFKNYVFTLFIGITLFGMGIIQMRKKDEDES